MYQMQSVTVAQAKIMFIETLSNLNSAKTVKTYDRALELFLDMLEKEQLVVDKYPVVNLTEDYVEHYITLLNELSPSTESLYLQVVKSFYTFLESEQLTNINLARVRSIIRQRSRRARRPATSFPEEDINRVIEFMDKLNSSSVQSGDEEVLNVYLREKRDRALILTLADTGLRTNEICRLRCGDFDWEEGRTIIASRGGKKVVVRFSSRAKDALKDYLVARAPLDMKSGRSLAGLPLFARHDKGVGARIKPITTTTCRNIVSDRVAQILGNDAVGDITPQTFMHYFVTTILRATGNLKLAQELARHKNIQVTQRYAHLSDDEINKSYYDVFEKK